MNIEFTDKEKIENFDTIASYFFKSNFGQLSKSDMELIMFKIYMDKIISTYKNEDGTIDYKKCSDYNISKDLGITQQRIRNLKVKNQLRNPINYDWKLALAGLIKNARFDDATKKVSLNIPDPNLYLEIQNFLEERGAYIEMQLNSKVLQIRPEYFLELSIMLESEENKKKIIKELKKNFKKSQKDNSVFDEKHIGKSLINSALNISEIIFNISNFISPENKIGSAIIKLIMSNLLD